jgi:hypothetical protein
MAASKVSFFFLSKTWENAYTEICFIKGGTQRSRGLLLAPLATLNSASHARIAENITPPHPISRDINKLVSYKIHYSESDHI